MLKKCLNRLFSRNEGTAFIEFAIVGPVVILLMMGIVEFSLIMFAEATLEGAIENAARTGSTGYNNTTNSNAVCYGQNQTQAQYIDCLLVARGGVGMTINNLQLSATDYTTYGGVGGITYNSCSNGPSAGPSTTPPSCASQQNFGNAGDVVVYTAQYPWNIITPYLQPMIGNNGVYTIQASAVVKNEPYPAAR